MPFEANPAEIKWSISFFAQSPLVTTGKLGREIGENDQWPSYLAPCSIQSRILAASALVTVLLVSGGGMRTDSSSDVIRSNKWLVVGSFGAMAAPSPRSSIADCRISNRSSAWRDSSSGP